MEKASIATKLLIVDDHESVLEGIKSFLEQKINNISISCFLHGEAVLQQIKRRRYDIYIIDLNLQDMDGENLISPIREENPNAKIIIYTMHEEIWYIKKLLGLDINGVVLKSSPIYNLKYAIEKVTKGECYYCLRFRRHKSTYSSSFLMDTDFSRTEFEIMQLISESYTYKEIAEITGHTESTIMSYKKKLFKKLGVNSAPELIAKAIANGFPIKYKVKHE